MDKKTTQKLNCWEYKKCGREPGGSNVTEICECTAAVLTSLPGGQYNNGTCCGRRCWHVVGTLCRGEVQGTFAQKINTCRSCDFYLKVKEEEGGSFVE
jgi:hypothetical protein